MSDCPYRSPISLRYEGTFPIKQCVRVKGINRDARYIEEDQVFQVRRKIILRIDKKKYRLVEYHFHVPSEHEVRGKKYPAEIHYVFYQISKKEEKEDCPKRKYFNVCRGTGSETDENILIVARTIIDGPINMELEDIQLQFPFTYFEYDGSVLGSVLGSDNILTPVRWIVGNTPIKLPLSEIKPVAKDSQPIQPLDNRIILFSC